MTRTARPPAGHPRSPMILVDGPEASGKTLTALQLAGDDRMGVGYVVEVGKADADDYAELGDFLLVEHNGALADITSSIRWVMHRPPIDDRPPVLVIDCGSDLWSLVRSDAEARARSSKDVQARLAKDEHAPVVIDATHWTAAKEAFLWPWLRELRTWPGITVVTARSEDLPVWAEGHPTGDTVIRLDLEREMLGRFDVRVRTGWPAPPVLLWSHRVGAPARHQLPTTGTLAHLLDEVLEQPPAGYLPALAKRIVHHLAIERGLTADEAVALAQMVWTDLELDDEPRIPLQAVATAAERVREATDTPEAAA
jgi:hypothetical protein